MMNNKMMVKKIDRLKRWTSEKLGQEHKTQESEEFKELEYEISMRYTGTERLYQALSAYLRNLSKRREFEDKDKSTPADILGQSMSIFGDEFVSESAYGQALVRLGTANQKLARAQENYVDRVNATFLAGVEKSLAQFRDYQVRLF